MTVAYLTHVDRKVCIVFAKMLVFRTSRLYFCSCHAFDAISNVPSYGHFLQMYLTLCVFTLLGDPGWTELLQSDVSSEQGVKPVRACQPFNHYWTLGVKVDPKCKHSNDFHGGHYTTRRREGFLRSFLLLRRCVSLHEVQCQWGLWNLVGDQTSTLSSD